MKYLHIQSLERQHGYNHKVQSEYEKYIAETQDMFDQVKSVLSKHFLSIYEKNDHFHDWNIDKFVYQTAQGKNKDKFIIHMSQENRKLLMIFTKITNLSIDTQHEDCRVWFGDTYMYDEWEMLDCGRIKYSMITFCSKMISLECSNVMIRTEK